MVIKCTKCDKDFECSTRKFNLNKKNNYKTYCSNKCKIDGQKTSLNLKCTTCNKDVERRVSQLEKSKSKKVFCSTSCAAKTNNRAKIGIKHPSFTDGKASYRNTKLRSLTYIICEKCGIDDIRVLEVHHIDKNRDNNKLENLKIFCANCHLIVHYEDRKNNKKFKI